MTAANRLSMRRASAYGRVLLAVGGARIKAISNNFGVGVIEALRYAHRWLTSYRTIPIRGEEAVAAREGQERLCNPRQHLILQKAADGDNLRFWRNST